MHNSFRYGRSGERSQKAARGNWRPARPQRGGRFQKASISQEKFINRTPTVREETVYTPVHSFADFGFHAHLLNNLRKKGFQEPMRIQDEAIPHVLSGRNVIGLANTGSGKTGAFILPIIHKMKTRKGGETALIITPTRELAGQIEQEFRRFSEGMRVYAALCVGGMGIRSQKFQLSRRPHVVIGTPGRLKDLLNQGALRLDSASILVLDEMDRMLDMGFLQDIEFLIGKLPKDHQSLCFSATITPTIAQLLARTLADPVTISVRTSETGEHIAQDVIRIRSEEEKFDRLVQLLSDPQFEKVLIFGEMKHRVQKLSDSLTRKGFPAEAIHGNKSQPQRQRALDAFKRGKVRILVATDVAARGLDIPNVSHVINFDQPHTHVDYIHRIGRTGRAGKGGMALTFVG